MVTSHYVELSFSVLEGSSPITHFLLNTSSLDSSSNNSGPWPQQQMIMRDNMSYVTLLLRDGVARNVLKVRLMVEGLEPSTYYTFQVAAVSAAGVGAFSTASTPTQLGM